MTRENLYDYIEFVLNCAKKEDSLIEEKYAFNMRVGMILGAAGVCLQGDLISVSEFNELSDTAIEKLERIRDERAGGLNNELSNAE